MAQHDYVIANGSGSAVRSDLNNALAAIVSQNSGATEPTDKFAYMWWADTSAGVLKLRNAANNAWISLRELDGTLTIEAGSASTPGLYFTGDANTGIYSPGADQFAIAAGGVERVEWGASEVVFNDGGENYDFRIEGDTEANLFFVDASTDRVGMGTVNPYQELTLRGTNEQLLFDLNTATNGQFASIAWNSATSDLGTGNYSVEIRGYREAAGAYGALAFHTRGAAATSQERVRIDSSGRLLVGTSTARSNFDGNTSTPLFQIEGVTAPTASASIVRGANDAIGSTFNLGKTRDAAVGGNTVVSSGDQIGIINFQGADGTNLIDAASIQAAVDGTPGANDMPGRLVFSTTADAAASPTEAMRINNAGELLVGYTADNGAYKLQVNSQIFATSATVATSDGRYKENVATLGGCLDLVKALRPVSFTWKPQEDIICDEKLIREGHNFPDGTQVGFIAQEVQEVLADKPWLGSVIKENTRPAINDDAGNELAPEEQFLGIAEGNLIAVLTNALQEAIAKIETLEAKVAALEAP